MNAEEYIRGKLDFINDAAADTLNGRTSEGHICRQKDRNRFM